MNQYGGAGSTYFSAFECGLLNATLQLWSHPFVVAFDGVQVEHLGQQLQGAGDTAVFVFAAMLNRNFSSTLEYENAVASLPPRIYAAQGARSNFVQYVLASPEFNLRICNRTLSPHGDAECRVTAAHRALLMAACAPPELALLAAQLANGSITVADVCFRFASQADGRGLYNETH